MQVVVRVSLEVPQIQFIARVRGHSSCAVTVFLHVAMKGFSVFLAIFRAPPVCPRVERQLGSPRRRRVLRRRGLGGGADAGSFSQVSGHQSCMN